MLAPTGRRSHRPAAPIADVSAVIPRALLLERAVGVLNRQLAESVSAARAAAELEGRSCRIAVEGLALDFALRIEHGRIASVPTTGREDVSIEGPPLDLLRLVQGQEAGRIHETRVRVSGEVRTAEKFAELLKLAAPDFEDELAGWIGDVPAHALAEGARRARAWMLAAIGALRDDTAEYLKEERRVLAGPHEAEEFYAGVDRLRDDVERAAARIDRLARALGPE
jgi:ubiquinone biosynthesis protein UbiJ